jgi:hypothetical protein
MSGPSVELVSDSEPFGSAAALAGALGSAILEPAWWPEDIGQLTYHVDNHPKIAPSYRIGSLRRDGRLIVVIGRPQRDGDPMRGLPSANWHPIAELASCSGAVSDERDAVRAVIMRDGQTVQLIGYMSEAEIVQAIESLRLVAGE